MTIPFAFIKKTGFTWVSTMSPTGNTSDYWEDIAYGNGTWVAVRRVGTERVATSTDGVTWTLRSSPLNPWACVEFGNGLFLAVPNSTSAGSFAMTSPDGINWTTRAMPAISGTTTGWSSLDFGNGIFVAQSTYFGNFNTARSTADGTSWSSGTVGSGHTGISRQYFGSGLFIANSNKSLTSSDGITWTDRGATDYVKAAYGGGLFVGIPANSNAVLTGANGYIWTTRPGLTSTLGGTHSPFGCRVAFGRDRFVVVNPTTSFLTEDGITWKEYRMPADSSMTYITSVAYGGGRFVAVGDGKICTAAY